MVPARSADLVVLGAGPAGLMAALDAARAGHRVVVVERETRPGGMAASFEVAGVRVDHGSHRLHPSIAPDIHADLTALLGDDLQVRPRRGRLHLAGRWVSFPLGPSDVARLPPRVGAGIARDALVPRRAPSEDTFAHVVRARLGPTIARDFYEPYVRKLWGVPAADLTGELADRRVSAGGIGSLVRRALGRRQGRTFLYPARGFGQISERLAEAVVDAGGELVLGEEVDRLRPGDDRVEVQLSGGHAVEASRVWSTVPVAVLPRLADPAPSGDVLAAVEGLEHRALALVYLVLDLPQYTPFDAHYFPSAEVSLSRLSEPKNYRDGPDPPDRTVLCAEVPCSVGDGRWTASDADLGAEVAGALGRVGLPPVEPAEVVVRRLPRVYAVYRPGFERRLATLEDWIGGQPRLTTLGRQGLFVGDNTHHVLAMGRAAAACLGPDGSFDDEAWQSAREGFRANVVED
jgi:protoporphyrinogen oxidase